jgi:hypothetical protein
MPGSLKSPLRMAAVGTVDRSTPISTSCLKYSKPPKKKALSLFLLKFVPGIRIGPPMLPPG